MRNRIPLLLLLLAVAFVGPVAAQTPAPAAPFQKVAELVDLPEYLPGIGILYVDPATLPAGPFLAYDRDGALLSTVYMLPLSALNARQDFTGLATGGAAVDRVDVQFNAGHPGVAEPHVHVVLWHVPAEKARELR
ncbi:MAG TPA: hypothetical protein VFQ21_00575 [Gemmatimonadota bacterium]|nr:hypothetical protein [Gemmatimonadota bacterium]